MTITEVFSSPALLLFITFVVFFEYLVVELVRATLNAKREERIEQLEEQQKGLKLAIKNLEEIKGQMQVHNNTLLAENLDLRIKLDNQ